MPVFSPDGQWIAFVAAGKLKKIRVAAAAAPVVLCDAENPNGITWDAANKRWLLAPFGGTDVQTLAPAAKNPTKLVAGPGQYDGIEVLDDGRILVSSWADSAVHLITNGTMTRIITGVSAPADIGVDTKRKIVAIPRFNDGKVEYFMIH